MLPIRSSNNNSNNNNSNNNSSNNNSNNNSSNNNSRQCATQLTLPSIPKSSSSSSNNNNINISLQHSSNNNSSSAIASSPQSRISSNNNNPVQPAEEETKDSHFLQLSNHGSVITSSLKELAAQNGYQDLILLCEGKKIVAHRLVLSAASQYLKTILEVS